MLIHVTPRFYTCERSGPNCHLVDLVIPELGILMRGGIELDTRRPFPNKRYNVACRKVGQKAIEGILIETPGPVELYTVIARWAVNAEGIITHKVTYKVLDKDFDAVSDKMLLWSASTVGSCAHESRWPASAKWSPASSAPCISLTQQEGRNGYFEDTIDKGLIVRREEVFEVPTIERNRILGGHLCGDRLPSSKIAFHLNHETWPQ